jgi:hypothetical protein
MHRTLFALSLAFALLRTGGASAQTPVTDAGKYATMLKSDKDADHRLRAAEQLGAIAAVKASYVTPHTTVLIEAFKADKDPAVRAAAGRALLAFEADPKAVTPAVVDVVTNEKEPGAVLTVGVRLAVSYKVKEVVAALEAIKDREEGKDDPKLRDQRLLQAVKQALRVLDR